MQSAITVVAPPQPGVEASLGCMLPYQREGIEWAVRHRKVLIADEMGLGKSAQALLACELAQVHPIVVVTPASVKDSWLQECQKWVPWRKVALANGVLPPAETDIIIVSPELLVRHGAELVRRSPAGVVLDESHYFKNHQAQRSALAEQLAGRAQLRILLSGSPIKNRRSDLVHQLSILDALPTVLSYHPDYHRYRETGRDPDAQEAAAVLFKGMDPDILHQALTDTVMIRRSMDAVGDTDIELRRIKVQLDVSEDPAVRAAEAAVVRFAHEASLQDYRGKDRLKLTVKLSGHVRHMQHAIAMAKLPAVVEWAAQRKAEGRRVLFFTYHQQVAEAYARSLPGRSLVITGSVPVHRRTAIIEDFANADFLVATMDSTAHGVNGLKDHAHTMAFLELDYTPTKHMQAEGRLRRKGQRSSFVEASYVTSRNTIEESIQALLDEKMRDYAHVLDGQELEEETYLGSTLNAIVEQRPWIRGRIKWPTKAPKELRRNHEQDGFSRQLKDYSRMPWGFRFQSGPFRVADVDGGLVIHVDGSTYPILEDGLVGVTAPWDHRQMVPRTLHEVVEGHPEAAAHWKALKSYERHFDDWDVTLDNFVRRLLVGLEQRESVERLCLDNTVYWDGELEIIPQAYTPAFGRQLRKDNPGISILNEFFPTRDELEGKQVRERKPEAWVPQLPAGGYRLGDLVTTYEPATGLRSSGTVVKVADGGFEVVVKLPHHVAPFDVRNVQLAARADASA